MVDQLRIFVLLGSFLLAAGEYKWAEQDDDDIISCTANRVQTDLRIEPMLGKWYIVEMLYHWQQNGEVTGDSVTDVCPDLHLSLYSTEKLRLIWHEVPRLTIEYNFTVPSNQPGIWTSDGAQKVGSIDSKLRYEHFAGKVTVVKAVSDHMVLMFCTPRVKVYSIILARKQYLLRRLIDWIHNMFSGWKYPIVAKVRTCGGGAAAIVPSLAIILALLAITLTKSKTD